MRTNTPPALRGQTHATTTRSELQQGCERRLRPLPPAGIAAGLAVFRPSRRPRAGAAPASARRLFRLGLGLGLGLRLPPSLPPRGAWHALAVGDAVDEVLPLRRAWLGLGLG